MEYMVTSQLLLPANDARQPSLTLLCKEEVI